MEQLDIFGNTKTKKAIEFIRKHEPSGEPYMLCYSGGKDSIVLEHLAMRSGVNYEVWYSLMHDPPEIIKFITTRQFKVNVLKPVFNFWRGVVKRFPPHRFSRWCCTEIKEEPTRKHPLVHRLIGIRSEESTGRSKLGMINQRTKKRINYHPIFHWKEWEIWSYIEEHNLEYPSLYDEGFSRLGCVVCPLRSLKETKKYKQRWPRHYVLYEKKCKEWWNLKGMERQKERGFETFEDFMSQWYIDLH